MYRLSLDQQPRERKNIEYYQKCQNIIMIRHIAFFTFSAREGTGQCFPDLRDVMLKVIVFQDINKPFYILENNNFRRQTRIIQWLGNRTGECWVWRLILQSGMAVKDSLREQMTIMDMGKQQQSTIYDHKCILASKESQQKGISSRLLVY